MGARERECFFDYELTQIKRELFLWGRWERREFQLLNFNF